MGNRTRKIAEILGNANHSTGKLAGANVDVSFENIIDTGTGGTRVAVGTTAQRGASQGMIRYNTTLGRFEATGDGSDYLKFATPHTVSSIDYPGSATALNTAGGESFTINGTNFVDGLTVTIDGTSPDSISVTDTVITVTGSPAKTAQTYTNGLVVTQDGVAVSINIDYSGTPAFNEASGSLGSFNEQTSVGTLDAGTDVGTAHAVTTGTLPSGTSIDSSTGAITGTLPANTNTSQPPESGGGDITTTFTVTATDAENQTSTRQFSIKNFQGDPLWTSTEAVMTGGSTGTNEAYNSNAINLAASGSNVYTQTGTKKFGTNAIYSNGTDTNNNIDITLPSSFNSYTNLCLEGWFYLETNQNNTSYPGGTQAYANQAFFAVGDTYMSLSIDPSGRVGYYYYDTGGSPQYPGQFDTSGNISTGSWNHIAFQFTSSLVKYWKNGTYISSISRGTLHVDAPLQIRLLTSKQGEARGWKGYIDDIRITSGERYTGTSNFTAPTEEIRKFAT